MTRDATTPGRAVVRRWRTTLSVAVIVIGAAVLVFVFNSRFGHDPRLVDSPLVGEPAPDLTLRYLEEEGALTLSDLEGQIVVLNFWASWCGPCRTEHAALTSASSVYDDKGVHFVGVLYQDQEARAVMFLDELGRGTNYSYVTDHDSRAIVEMGVFGVPETYFIDAEGVVRGRVQGDIDPSLLVQTIEQLLVGRTPDI